MPRHKQRTEHYITKSYDVFVELHAVPIETGANMFTRFLTRLFVHGPRRADLSSQLQGIYALAQVHATLAVADAITEAAKAGLPAAEVTAAVAAAKTDVSSTGPHVKPAPVPDTARPPADRTEAPAFPQQVVIVSGDSLAHDPELTAVFERARGYTGEVPIVQMEALAS